MFICYFNFEFWWLDQHLIPSMWQLVFANISIQEWIIDSDYHNLPDGFGNASVFPAHYDEIVHI